MKGGERLLVLVLFLLIVLVGLIIYPVFHIRDGKKASFTLIVLPDTQKYSESYPHIFMNQTEWIVDKKDELDITFVIHLGDIVEHWNNETQWGRADESLSVLDENGIAYSVVPGNHDHYMHKTNGSTYYYNKYFPVSRFLSKVWWGGGYNGNDNNYELMTILGQDYIFLSLDYCASDDELEWANEILERYSDRKAILTTHAYLDDSTAKREGIHNCKNGSTEYIWHRLIKRHANLQIVLSGHEWEQDGQARRVDKNIAGKNVYQLLADYQNYDKGGNGFLRILKFVPSENRVYVSTYSPYMNRYKTDDESDFVLEL